EPNHIFDIAVRLPLRIEMRRLRGNAHVVDKLRNDVLIPVRRNRIQNTRRVHVAGHAFEAVILAHMPICEIDPWRLQYFRNAVCPADLYIPTEDSDAWMWNPAHRAVYDKLAIALSQGLAAGPHGTMPPHFPVFSKPIVNLKGMGIGGRVLRSPA